MNRTGKFFEALMFHLSSMAFLISHIKMCKNYPKSINSFAELTVYCANQ